MFSPALPTKAPAQPRAKDEEKPFPLAATPRAVVLGMALGGANAFWVLQCGLRWWTVDPTIVSLFANAVVTLLGVAGINAWLRKRWPQRALRRGELLLIFSMVSIASAMAGVFSFQLLVPFLIFPFQSGSIAQQWAQPLSSALSPALLPGQADIRGLFEGGSTLFLSAHLRAWAWPMACWSGFIGLLLLIMVGLNALLWPRWGPQERLTFPVVELPFQITASKVEFWRHPLLWIATGLAVFPTLLSVLHFFFPSVPRFPLTFWLGPAANMPWRAGGRLFLLWRPLAFGLAFIMPLQMSFSLWIFILWWHLQRVLAAALGLYIVEGEFPYINEQALGGYLGLAILAVWTGRRQLLALLRFWGEKAKNRGEHNLPLSPLLACGLLVAGCAGLVVFCRRLGMSYLALGAFFVFYFAIVLGITRIRAQVGPPSHELGLSGPDQMLPTLLGSLTFSRSDLLGFSLLSPFNQTYLSHPMPHQMEAFSLCERARASLRGIPAALIAAGVVGSLVTLAGSLHLLYKYGLGSAHLHAPLGALLSPLYGRLSSWETVPSLAHYSRLGACGVGLGTVLFLAAFNSRFLAWPFHPAAYAVSNGFFADAGLLGFFTCWLIKFLVLRFGTRSQYEKLRILFLGFILGDMMGMTFQTLAAVIGGLSIVLS